MIGIGLFSKDFDGISDTEIALKNLKNYKFYSIIFALPGSDKDECKRGPLLSFPLFVPITTDDDSLLLVDENDIRELSSPITKTKLNEILFDNVIK